MQATSSIADVRSADPRRRDRLATAALRGAAACWLGTALLGQLVFAVYVTGFYGRATVQGHPERWNRVMPHGYVAGDTFFNLVLGLHLLFVVAIVVGGVLQLLPPLRRRAPGFHRWNGRAYLVAAAVLSLGGLAMVWLRGGMVGDLSQHLGVSLNAVLILGFVVVAWRHARARRWVQHRRWALRLFLAVSGVWFFRVGLMFWLVVNGGPVGFDPDAFTGPFLSVLSFAQCLVPLGVLELYFHAEGRREPRIRFAMAGGLCVATFVTLVGIGAATAFMWLPPLRG